MIKKIEQNLCAFILKTLDILCNYKIYMKKNKLQSQAPYDYAIPIINLKLRQSIETIVENHRILLRWTYFFKMLVN